MVFDPSLLSKPETYEGFRNGGTIVACGTDVNEVLASGVKPGRIVMVDGLKIAFETIKKNITNMIMLGTFAKATGMVGIEDLQAAMVTGLGPAMAKKNETAMKRGYDEAVIYDYDNVEKEEKAKPLFLEHITSCKQPPKPAYEAPWGDTSETYQIAATGTWRFRRPWWRRRTASSAESAPPIVLSSASRRTTRAITSPIMTIARGAVSV